MRPILLESVMIQLYRHAGPAWQVAWAHPKYESVLATCGYDKKIKIWKEVKVQSWDVVYEIEAAASVNCISWAPWEYGLILAAGSADGKIHILQRKGDDTWNHTHVDAHGSGINALSWGPPTEPSMLSQEHITAQISDQQHFALPPKRLVSVGNDQDINFWMFKDSGLTKWLAIPNAHDDWIRDVAWSNNIGLMHDTIASCSEDQKVKIWKRVDPNKNEWEPKEININTPAWKVSWS